MVYQLLTIAYCIGIWYVRHLFSWKCYKSVVVSVDEDTVDWHNEVHLVYSRYWVLVECEMMAGYWAEVVDSKVDSLPDNTVGWLEFKLILIMVFTCVQHK